MLRRVCAFRVERNNYVGGIEAELQKQNIQLRQNVQQTFATMNTTQ